MTKEEYKRWTQFMKESRGQWTIDQIHNGQEGQDLLLFKPHQTIKGHGLYIAIQQSGLVTAGVYNDAFPHIGEAMFDRRWEKRFGSFNAAKAIVLERTLMINGGR